MSKRMNERLATVCPALCPHPVTWRHLFRYSLPWRPERPRTQRQARLRACTAYRVSQRGQLKETLCLKPPDWGLPPFRDHPCWLHTLLLAFPRCAPSRCGHIPEMCRQAILRKVAVLTSASTFCKRWFPVDVIYFENVSRLDGCRNAC